MDAPSHSSPRGSESARVPQVRARHTQTLLRLGEARVPADAPTLASALDPRMRAVLESADPASWVPLEVDVAIVEVLNRRFGAAGAASIVDANVRMETDSTLLAGLVKTVLHVFAPSPAAIVKQIPAGWGRLFRDAGWVEVVSTGPRAALVRFHRLPAVCVASPAWVESVLVGLRSLYSLVGATGTVESRVEDAAHGTVLVTFRWK